MDGWRLVDFIEGCDYTDTRKVIKQHEKNIKIHNYITQTKRRLSEEYKQNIKRQKISSETLTKQLVSRIDLLECKVSKFDKLFKER